jgi:hypothetical protein
VGKYCQEQIPTVSVIKYIASCDSMLVNHTLQYVALFLHVLSECSK